MPVPTLRQLLEAGIHFGHQTRRWNPKMAKYIFGQRNGIYIIDLQKTLEQMGKAYALTRDTVARGGTVLFVGTKKAARDTIGREAQHCGMYYVNNRWLGGTLTNFATIRRTVQRLLALEEQEASAYFDALPKKEASHLRRVKTKLERNLTGIKGMERLPGLVFVIDTRKEAISVAEAERMGIPCVGVVDTNADPDKVPIPIPGNDDAMRAINLYCSLMAEAVLEGLALGQKTEEVVPPEESKNLPERAAPVESVLVEVAEDESDAEEEG